MKKFIRILGLSVASILAVTSLSFAVTSNYNKAAIKVKQRKKAVKIDGKDKDKDWKKAKNYASQINHYKKNSDGSWNGGKTTPQGTSVKTWKMLWDKNYLYVYMYVKDTTQSTSFKAGADCDNVEYHIDAKNCKKATLQRKCDSQYRLARDGKVSGWGSDGENTYADTGFKSTKNAKSVDKKGKYYTQEVRIKMSKHGVSALKAGKKVGFDLQINDSHEFYAGRDYQLVWNAKDTAWTEPASMGTIKLVK